MLLVDVALGWGPLAGGGAWTMLGCGDWRWITCGGPLARGRVARPLATAPVVLGGAFCHHRRSGDNILGVALFVFLCHRNQHIFSVVDCCGQLKMLEVQFKRDGHIIFSGLM